MKIAVIGAGPAGLTSAKQALEAGHDVTVFEKHAEVGGIWNPASGGAYPGVRMQSSRMSFPFSDFAPIHDAPFPDLAQVHEYLTAYAARFGVDRRIRFNAVVDGVRKSGSRWRIRASTSEGPFVEEADAVMIATGELWEPVRPDYVPDRPACAILTAKDYRDARPFAGQRVLVVGGGVSGADIASELSAHARSVDWSVRHKALFLPRMCGGVYNDDLFSYVTRIAVEEMDYRDYLGLLGRIMPDYMALYSQTGLLPGEGFQNAVHVNDTIIPLVQAGKVRPVPAFERFHADGRVRFADGSEQGYDAVILCMGYRMADYSFVEGFEHWKLYQHFIYADDPTLGVINTPVDTNAYGTACPYFEAIAGWVLRIFAGDIVLPPRGDMLAWCREHMTDLANRRFYDCWLETIRLKLDSGTLPDPETSFADYWKIVAGQVAPACLCGAAPARPAAWDHVFDIAELKARLLAGLSAEARDRALASAEIDADDHARAAAMPPGRALSPRLPYRMRHEAAPSAAIGARERRA